MTINAITRSLSLRWKLTTMFLVSLLALGTSIVGMSTSASAAAVSAPIIGTTYNPASASSNCAGNGVLYPNGAGGVHYNVSWNAASIGEERYTGSGRSGYFSYNNFIQDSATVVEEMPYCVNGDWTFALLAQYASSYVHRTWSQQFYCANAYSCTYLGNTYSNWASGWV
jgi:hypothetical protein